MTTLASAPGKLILCGEHAVVYRRPAIALPLGDVRAHVAVEPGPPGNGVVIDAPDLERRWSVAASPTDPLSELVCALLAYFDIAIMPDLLVTIRSEIPIAGGMGSGAAVATALVRALAQHLGHNLLAGQISALVYDNECRLHGTPSGIDNTVVAYEQPIWFQRRSDHAPQAAQPPQPPLIEPIRIGAPFTLVIGDTGVRSPTRLPVGEVRRRWLEQPEQYDILFDAVADVVVRIRAALHHGDLPVLGALLDRNQALLQKIGVSSPELDRLVEAARAAGALGAKLSGAGWGGVMIALVTPTTSEAVAAALHAAGAARVLVATVARHQQLGL